MVVLLCRPNFPSFDYCWLIQLLSCEMNYTVIGYKCGCGPISLTGFTGMTAYGPQPHRALAVRFHAGLRHALAVLRRLGTGFDGDVVFGKDEMWLEAGK